jgi:tRNA threonylcarbamoyladenosine biosynthesis protein TsaB
MIVLLDTSTPLCQLSFVDGAWRHDAQWQADRQLAHGLLGYISGQLTTCNKTWADITGIGVMQGPGSFTGLRIGLTVMNTLADAQEIPIVGVTGETWQQKAIDALERGEDQRIVLPFYGGEAHITSPRK